MLTELEAGGKVTPRMKRKIFQHVAETLQSDILSGGQILCGSLGHTCYIFMSGRKVTASYYDYDRGQKSFEYIFKLYGDPEVVEEQDIMKKIAVGVTRVELPLPPSPAGLSSPPALLDLVAHSLGKRLTVERDVEQLGLQGPGLEHLRKKVGKYVSTISLFSQ